MCPEKLYQHEMSIKIGRVKRLIVSVDGGELGDCVAYFDGSLSIKRLRADINSKGQKEANHHRHRRRNCSHQAGAFDVSSYTQSGGTQERDNKGSAVIGKTDQGG